MHCVLFYVLSGVFNLWLHASIANKLAPRFIAVLDEFAHWPSVERFWPAGCFFFYFGCMQALNRSPTFSCCAGRIRALAKCRAILAGGCCFFLLWLHASIEHKPHVFLLCWANSHTSQVLSEFDPRGCTGVSGSAPVSVLTRGNVAHRYHNSFQLETTRVIFFPTQSTRESDML